MLRGFFCWHPVLCQRACAAVTLLKFKYKGMADNIISKLDIEEFAKHVIDLWEKKVMALKIGYSDQLLDSFHQHVAVNADGDPTRIEFTFKYYGFMVDYGVGRGVNLRDRDMMVAAGLTKRVKKPWYTETFYKKLAHLRHILEEKAGHEIANKVVISVNKMNDGIVKEKVTKNSPDWKKYAKAKGR